MTLATILGLYVLTLGWLPASVHRSSLPAAERGATVVTLPSPAPVQSKGTEGSTSNSSAQAAAGQNPNSNPASTPNVQTSSRPKQPPKPRAAKKAIYPCSDSPAALNPVLNSHKLAKPDSSASNSSSSAATVTDGNAGKNSAQNAAASRPCTPQKKIVRNGGSKEPKIELLGGTQAEHASNERSTAELTSATEANLKQIAGRELSSNQQSTVAQIKQFMEQSKKADAAGDPDRAHSLAMKARLLSDELVKP